MTDFIEPDYSKPNLKDVFPSSLAVLGGGRYENILDLPPAKHVIVLLVDGLGVAQLKALKGHTPFLRSQNYATIECGFPSTTACSLASLGTGRAPGEHGLLGYQLLNPDTGQVVPMLGNWDPSVDAGTWQPYPSVFETAEVKCFSVGSGKYECSDLTAAILAGAEYRVEEHLEDILSTSIELSRDAEATLVYAYWNKIDYIGHKCGWNSHEYAEQIERLDSVLAATSRELPEDILLVVTADHGMIDTSASEQIILNSYPELMDAVTAVAGEPRTTYLYGKNPSLIHDIAQQELGDYALVLARDEAIDAGYFGEVRPEARERIGDVILIARENYVFFDIEAWGPGPLNMIGQHGSMTKDEREIPLLTLVGSEA